MTGGRVFSCAFALAATCACAAPTTPTTSRAPTSPAIAVVECKGEAGSVDLDAVIDRTHERTEIEAAVKKRAGEMEQELAADTHSIEAMSASLQKESKVLSKEALKAKTDELQQRMLALQTKFARRQQELAAFQASQRDAARGRIRFFVSVRGRELAGGLIAIVESHATLWVRTGCPGRPTPLPKVDLTETVGVRYDELSGETARGTTM